MIWIRRSSDAVGGMRIWQTKQTNKKHRKHWKDKSRDLHKLVDFEISCVRNGAIRPAIISLHRQALPITLFQRHLGNRPLFARVRVTIEPFAAQWLLLFTLPRVRRQSPHLCVFAIPIFFFCASFSVLSFLWCIFVGWVINLSSLQTTLVPSRP